MLRREVSCSAIYEATGRSRATITKIAGRSAQKDREAAQKDRG
jgi:hypothetical protein